MNASPRNKLFFMMVLQFFIWGAWLPLIFKYLPSLGFNSTWEQPLILNAFPIAAIIGMFFSNQFADRTFSAERFLAFSHLVGGIAILSLAFVRSFWPFFFLMLVHCLVYVPTISIVNSIAFANLKDAKQEFGLVRMGGTIGWILAAWPFTFILVNWQKVNANPTHGMIDWLKTVFDSPLEGAALERGIAWTFAVSGAASLILAAFSLTLPHTPPKPKSALSKDRFAWMEAVRLLKLPFVFVLWIVTLIDAFVHNCFFNWSAVFLNSPQVGIAGRWIMLVMSLGQVSEILTMFILGATLKRLGWRITMIVGILGHAARFAVFAFLPEHQTLIILVNLLHGVCYAFFFATVYIFVDAYLPKDVRTSAQGLFNVMILGFGSLIANTICPKLIQVTFKHGDAIDFRGLFLVPCLFALGAACLLAVAFHPPKEIDAAAGPVAAPH